MISGCRDILVFVQVISLKIGSRKVDKKAIACKDFSL